MCYTGATLGAALGTLILGDTLGGTLGPTHRVLLTCLFYSIGGGAYSI